MQSHKLLYVRNNACALWRGIVGNGTFRIGNATGLYTYNTPAICNLTFMIWKPTASCLKISVTPIPCALYSHALFVLNTHSLSHVCSFNFYDHIQATRVRFALGLGGLSLPTPPRRVCCIFLAIASSLCWLLRWVFVSHKSDCYCIWICFEFRP